MEMVIPFLPEATLDAHPAFARLWTYITTEILEDDASRKSVNEERVGRWQAQVKARRDNFEFGGAGRSRSGGEEEEQDQSLPEHEEAMDDGYGGARRSQVDGQARGRRKGMKENDKEKLRLEEALNKARVETMQLEILTDVLREISQSSQSKQLTLGLRDDLLVISAYIDASRSNSPGRSEAGSDARKGLLSIDGQELLEDDIVLFKENMSTVADVVGKRLVEIESGLAKLAGIAALDEEEQEQDDQQAGGIRYDEGTSTRAPERDSMNRATPGDRPSKDLSTLFSSLTAQVDHLATLRQTLPTRLTTMSGTLTTLLALQRDLLSQQLRTLEATKHGVISRHAQARMTFFATVARAMDLKTRVLLLEERCKIETGEHADARKAFVGDKIAELDGQEARLDQRIRELQGALDEYERAGEDAGYGRDGGVGVHVMTKLGRKYGAVEREMEEVRADIARLEAQTQIGRGR